MMMIVNQTSWSCGDRIDPFEYPKYSVAIHNQFFPLILLVPYRFFEMATY